MGGGYGGTQGVNAQGIPLAGTKHHNDIDLFDERHMPADVGLVYREYEKSHVSGYIAKAEEDQANRLTFDLKKQQQTMKWRR